MNHFLEGFYKEAKLHDTQWKNTAMDVILDTQVPLGTTMSTAFGARPEGHSRLKEFGTRAGAGLAGVLAGAGLGLATKNPALVSPLASMGLLGGSIYGAHSANKKYYNNGRLKKEYKE